MTVDQIRRFAEAWYLALDQHAPLEHTASFLTDRGLYMRLPEGDFRDFDGFKRWYDRVTHLFFDENHTINDLVVTFGEDEAEVRIVVGWQASWFEPPAAKSKRVSMDATQRWLVRPSTRNAHGLEIVTYEAQAEPIQYAPGFARL